MANNFFQNTCKPEGFGGKLMVNMMNNGHVKLSEWGRQYLELKSTDYILDAGCGGGANVAVMLKECQKGKVIGLDYSEVSVEKSRKVNSVAIQEGRCEVLQGNVLELPFEAETFDVVTAFETVYFWPGLDNAFKQVQRVLKKGGTFMICNESNGDNAMDEKWTKMIDGMTIYSKEQLTEYLKNAGFAEIQVHKNEKNWMCVIARKI